jgi:hypothetical protein
MKLRLSSTVQQWGDKGRDFQGINASRTRAHRGFPKIATPSPPHSTPPNPNHPLPTPHTNYLTLEIFPDYNLERLFHYWKPAARDAARPRGRP